MGERRGDNADVVGSNPTLTTSDVVQPEYRLLNVGDRGPTPRIADMDA